MNKKAQLSAMGVIYAFVGALIALVISSRMEAGFILKIISVVATAGVCYLIGYKAFD